MALFSAPLPLQHPAPRGRQASKRQALAALRGRKVRFVAIGAS